MNCEEFRRRLSEYLDGELDDAQESKMLQHAEACPPCQEQLTQTVLLLDELEKLGDSVPVPLPAQSAWRKAVRALSVRRSSGFSRFSRAVAGMAAALLVLFGATWTSRINGVLPASQPMQASYASNSSGEFDDVGAFPVSLASSAAETRVYGPMSDGALKKDDEQTPPPMEDESAAHSPAASVLRVMRSASVQIETQDYEADLAMLDDIVLGNNGYFELREISSQNAMALHAIVRVPVDSLDDFLTELSVIGRTVRKAERAVDASSQFVDLDERLNACEERLNKLYLLQAQCEDVSNLLTISQSISECIAEQESLLGRQNGLSNTVAYASVEINLSEPETSPIVQDIGSQTISQRIAQGFEQSLQWLGSFSADALVLLVSNLPRLVIFIPALVLVILLIRWAFKKRR